MFFYVGLKTYVNAAQITTLTFTEVEGVRKIMYVIDKQPLFSDLGSEEADRLCAVVFPGMTREEIEAKHFGGGDAEPGPVRKPSKGGGPKPRGAARRLEPVGGPVGYW